MSCDMGTMINRRRVMGGGKSGYTLIHHWEADDWTVGSNWVDRVGGLVFTRSDNPIKQDGLIGCCRQYGFFSLRPNSAAPNGIDMGSEWMVEVECLIEDVTLSNPYQVQTAVDFGSVGNVSHAFCLGVSSRKISFNPKFTGNNSSPLYDQYFDFNPYYNKVVKISIGTEEVDSNTVLPFYMVEDEIKYSPNTLTKQEALFNRNFNNNIVLLGTNVNGARSDIYDNTNQYKYIKSIKIYSKK